MNRSGCQLLLGVMVLCGAGSLARADAPVDNPKYHAWSKFKAGSSETFEADIQSQGKRYHITTTQTLLSVSDDEVVVETASASKLTGQKESRSTKRETFKAKIQQEELKVTGEKDIDAMAKTFKCKVYEGTGKSSATGADAARDGLKGTIFICDDVPGGLVRLDVVDPDGKLHTFILTAMDVK